VNPCMKQVDVILSSTQIHTNVDTNDIRSKQYSCAKLLSPYGGS
jgi:hypothetical protein